VSRAYKVTWDAAFAHFPVLATERLCLRRVGPGDDAGLFAIKADAEVTSRYAQEPHTSIEQTRAWIQRLETDYARREVLFWGIALKDSDSLVGSCTFWNFGPGLRCVELGYELGRAHWGQGIASEAVAAVLHYGFTELGLHRVEACPLAANDASQRLLRKLGFTHEGDLRQREFFRGQFYDQLYFGLLADEWSVNDG
jgi:ribosomal-protein-alanine N-acetyltransferase